MYICGVNINIEDYVNIQSPLWKEKQSHRKL